jgi:hypothetical protein
VEEALLDAADDYSHNRLPQMAASFPHYDHIASPLQQVLSCGSDSGTVHNFPVSATLEILAHFDDLDDGPLHSEPLPLNLRSYFHGDLSTVHLHPLDYYPKSSLLVEHGYLQHLDCFFAAFSF